MNRRWEDDDRGRGIGDASAHVPALEELASLAAEPDWVAEDPEAHLLPGLRRGAEATGLTITSFASDHAGRFIVHLKGGAAMSRRDLRQAAWTILGCVAELSSHVSEVKDESGVTFDVVTGMPKDGAPFATHGHSLRLVIDAIP